MGFRDLMRRREGDGEVVYPMRHDQQSDAVTIEGRVGRSGEVAPPPLFTEINTFVENVPIHDVIASAEDALAEDVEFLQSIQQDCFGIVGRGVDLGVVAGSQLEHDVQKLERLIADYSGLISQFDTLDTERIERETEVWRLQREIEALQARVQSMWQQCREESRMVVTSQLDARDSVAASRSDVYDPRAASYDLHMAQAVVRKQQAAESWRALNTLIHSEDEDGIVGCELRIRQCHERLLALNDELAILKRNVYDLAMLGKQLRIRKDGVVGRLAESIEEFRRRTSGLSARLQQGTTPVARSIATSRSATFRPGDSVLSIGGGWEESNT